jgi:hypothetical protein
MEFISLIRMNRYMNDLQPLFKSLLDNMKIIDFLQYNKIDGTKEN